MSALYKSAHVVGLFILYMVRPYTLFNSASRSFCWFEHKPQNKLLLVSENIGLRTKEIKHIKNEEYLKIKKT